MSDSMCGPSNGAKTLLAHADRDRTLHQDRLVNSPNSAAGASFRNRPSFAADGAYETFQQAPMLDAPGPSLGLANNTFLNNPGVPAFHAGPAPGVFGHAVGGAPATASPMHSSRAAAHGWVDQFASMQLRQDTAHAAPAMSSQAMPATMSTATHNSMMGLQDDHMAYNTRQFGGMGMGVGTGMGMGMGMSMDDPFVMHGTATNNFTHQQPQFVLTDHVESALDIEAFNRAFGEYDESSFEQELAEWAEKEKAEKAQQAQQEFEAAEAEWMAQHGPSAENNTKVGPPTDEEMATIDADLENLAEEMEAKEEAEARRREGNEELAKAANAILTSVADNQSEKFQKSTFLDLMRRIGNREVEVDGDKLVDVATGEKVSTSPPDFGPNDDVSGPSDANDKGNAPAEPASSA
ncbi:hypothetical protein NEUTE1DRAFT_131960 [Neurospora tetrasperma FGSC 2508]|uniref:Peroxin 20 n=1 Tax=Neurospora tetrasperma (strain FGSC 2508 / ATCC MYA-4615 / P0657) TaxID=510951 RepID=F8MXF8_NEUT8|nr:uncharacterized protein NEUTE1DRAFT_131960 [Neurospora tetrasperma FGSC 2508]EGO54429.1 hypothetical protein NEUTE1DRAFT_131960 [Neurospora tetrasperma FGSC 2508]EGZ68126.1 peroxisome biogenesis factor 20 [Neurospora tetrasperma FGSC 2509]